MSLVVPKYGFMPDRIRPSIAANSGPRWLIIWRPPASRTLGGRAVGPGMRRLGSKRSTTEPPGMGDYRCLAYALMPGRTLRTGPSRRPTGDPIPMESIRPWTSPDDQPLAAADAPVAVALGVVVLALVTASPGVAAISTNTLRRRPPVRPSGGQGRSLPRRARPGAVGAGHGGRPGSERATTDDATIDEVRRRSDRADGLSDDVRRHRPRTAPTPVAAPTATPEPTPARDGRRRGHRQEPQEGLRPRAEGHLVRIGRRPDGPRHPSARATRRMPSSARSRVASTSGRARPTATTAIGVRRRWRWRSMPTACQGYEVRAYKTRQGALRDAAKAIQKTKAPVLLLAWRGAHTWVMTGFRADADPSVFARREDPGHLHPRPVVPGRLEHLGTVRPARHVPEQRRDGPQLPEVEAPRGSLPGRATACTSRSCRRSSGRRADAAPIRRTRVARKPASSTSLAMTPAA